MTDVRIENGRTAPFPCSYSECTDTAVHCKRLEDSSLKKTELPRKKATNGDMGGHAEFPLTQMLVPDTDGQVQTFVGNLQRERGSQSQQREKRNCEELGTEERQKKIKVILSVLRKVIDYVAPIIQELTGCFKKRSYQRTRKCSCTLQAQKKKNQGNFLERKKRQ